MSLSRNTSLLIFLLSLLFSGACKAIDQSPLPMPKRLGEQQMPGANLRPFSIHDTDQDGLLSRKEYRRFSEQLALWRQTRGRPTRNSGQHLSFEVIDSNNDGYISEDEMISVLNKRLKRHRRYRHRGGRW
jgi:Ca2+-binding EF-hand superfamily protein